MAGPSKYGSSEEDAASPTHDLHNRTFGTLGPSVSLEGMSDRNFGEPGPSTHYEAEAPSPKAGESHATEAVVEAVDAWLRTTTPPKLKRRAEDTLEKPHVKVARSQDDKVKEHARMDSFVEPKPLDEKSEEEHASTKLGDGTASRVGSSDEMANVDGPQAKDSNNQEGQSRSAAATSLEDSTRKKPQATGDDQDVVEEDHTCRDTEQDGVDADDNTSSLTSVLDEEEADHEEGSLAQEDAANERLNVATERGGHLGSQKPADMDISDQPDVETKDLTDEMQEVAKRVRAAEAEKDNLRKQASFAVKKLKAEFEAKKDECNGWRLEAMEARAKEEQRAAKVKEEQKERKKTMQDTIRLSEEDHKKKSDKRVDDVKANYRQKFTAARNESIQKANEKEAKLREESEKKMKALQKKTDAAAAKYEGEIQTLEDQVADMKEERKQEKEERKKEKAEMLELRKTLKKEQQEEIKKHKPETAEKTKELSKTLAEKGKEIRKLQDMVQELKERVDKVLQANASLKKKNQDLDLIAQKYLNERKDLIQKKDTAEAEVERMKDVLVEGEEWSNKKAEAASKKVQLQLDKTDFYARTADDHRRGLFTMRNGMDASQRTIVGLRAEVVELKAQVERLKGVGGGEGEDEAEMKDASRMLLRMET